MHCQVTADSEPPFPISASSISITQLVFTDKQLSLSYSWSPPSIPNGLIKQYQARIAAEPLEPHQENQPMHFSFMRDIVEVYIVKKKENAPWVSLLLLQQI